jgi:hypothetical protein
MQFVADAKDKRRVRPTFQPFFAADLASTSWTSFPMYAVDVLGVGAPLRVRLPFGELLQHTITKANMGSDATNPTCSRV